MQSKLARFIELERKTDRELLQAWSQRELLRHQLHDLLQAKRANISLDDVRNSIKGVADNLMSEGIKKRFGDLLGRVVTAWQDPAKRPYVTALVGTLAGSGAMLGAEAMSGRKKKRYLNALLTGGTAGGLLGLTGGYLHGQWAPGTIAQQNPAAAANAKIINEAVKQIHDNPGALDEANRAAQDQMINGWIDTAANNKYVKNVAGLATGYGGYRFGKAADNIWNNRLVEGIARDHVSKQSKEFNILSDALKRNEDFNARAAVLTSKINDNIFDETSKNSLTALQAEQRQMWHAANSNAGIASRRIPELQQAMEHGRAEVLRDPRNPRFSSKLTVFGLPVPGMKRESWVNRNIEKAGTDKRIPSAPIRRATLSRGAGLGLGLAVPHLLSIVYRNRHKVDDIKNMAEFAAQQASDGAGSIGRNLQQTTTPVPQLWTRF